MTDAIRGLGVLFDERQGIMAGKMARKKPDTARAKTPVIETVVAAEEALAEQPAPPAEGAAASEASRPDEAAPCTRSHIPNARTAKTLRDAEAGRNLTEYASVEEMFKALGL